MNNFNIGDIIVRGSGDAGEVVEQVAKDKRWKTSGVRIMKIRTSQFGGNVGMTEFVPDYLLSSWKVAPTEWTKNIGGQTEERYAWTEDGKMFRREVRAVDQK